jgi:hypothetical protein
MNPLDDSSASRSVEARQRDGRGRREAALDPAQGEREYDARR